MTKSCECLRRCQAYFCRKDSKGQEFCEGWLMGDFVNNRRACYEREGVSPDEQYSAIPEPEELAAPSKVKCMTGHTKEAVPLECSEALQQGDGTNAPVSACPGNCNHNGYCTRGKGQTEGRGQCRCHRGWTGAECETKENRCYLKCNGKGECTDQFCKCEPPYFSIGCSRSTVYPTNYTRPSPVDFKIYMYELNTQYAYDNSYWFGWQGHDPIYVGYTKFMEQFLLSSVRTEDPSEANLFYIPSFTYSYSTNVGTAEEHIHLLLDHIKHTYPYWNRTGGRDHFLFVPADRGACHIGGVGKELIFDPIKIVHFGMHTLPGHKGPFPHHGHPTYGCYNPLRDVVNVPNWPEASSVLGDTGQYTVDELLKQKKSLFFFAGGVRPDTEYSGNTRQILDKLLKEWKDPEFDWNEGFVGDYTGRLRASKFCLAPYGFGYGMRLPQALISGCVPVIIQDHVFVPYQDILSYEDFSIRLSNDDLPHIREILKGVSEEQYRQLLDNVLKVAAAFSWDAERGGRAFDFTIASLRRKHMNLKALFYPVYSELPLDKQ
ncbi:exostosin-like glycosyltransferase [Micractinium conductrix]|uniref:Exostosin-like glycosyltransferase n=1 Tax=Micractinium conductrix TaxID=554055 RepID=A0A2P6VLP3_9CHLO|nr:exostosin-like glycosyltransferase [Micractinium conductrix]|eukprot:PSC74977.1 exostosin-like glycosyltransferase [Micractinium conductrix]